MWPHTKISVRSLVMAKQIEHGPTNLGCFCIGFQCQVSDNPTVHAAVVGRLVPLPLSFREARAGRKLWGHLILTLTNRGESLMAHFLPEVESIKHCLYTRPRAHGHWVMDSNASSSHRKSDNLSSVILILNSGWARFYLWSASLGEVSCPWTHWKKTHTFFICQKFSLLVSVQINYTLGFAFFFL